jgi:hypothetical protein
MQNNNLIKRILAYSAQKIKVNPPLPYSHIKPRNKFRLTFSKRPAIPVQTWTGPEGFRRLKLPQFLVSLHIRWQGSLTHWPHIPAGNIPGTHFCWGHGVAGTIKLMKNPSDPHQELNTRLGFSTVPEPTAPCTPPFLCGYQRLICNMN